MLPLDVSPDFSAVTGNTLASVVGALLTIVLITSVASLVAAAICWAYGEANGNYQLSAKGKAGVFIALGAAALSGAGVAWANFLIDVGQRV
jgi:phosphatidylglycerophosphate synthase